MVTHLISKSSFIRGMQCPKSLFLHFFKPELRDEISDSQQALFDTGHGVGEIAQQKFPGGIDASRGDHSLADEAVKYTQELIRSGQKIIYEAAFSTGESLCYMDILVKEGREWAAYEVKASTSVKEYHLQDVAYQYFTITHSGLSLKEISLVHIYNQFVREGALDPDELFTIVPLKEVILPMQEAIPEHLALLQDALGQDTVPDIGIGPHCSNPFQCDFVGYCWRDIPEFSVFNISRMGASAFHLYEEGIVEVCDIPVDFPLSAYQQIQVEAVRSGEIHCEPDQIGDFLEELEYPLCFLDFETINPALPLFDGTRPYQMLAFQYSIHIQDTPDSPVRHREFLSDTSEMTDPRPGLIRKLIEDLEGSGTILAYNKGFESARLREMAESFPEYEDELLDLQSRLVDLMTPFQQGWYYSPEMKGSYSIKAVLPALVPELSYKNLEVQEGGTASNYFIGLFFEKDQQKVSKMRKALLEYCKMDTFAMVKVLEVLKNIG